MAKRTRPAGCCAKVSTTPLPDAEAERLAHIAKALSDPNRIRILHLLAGQDGPLCACDVVDHLELSQPTVSHHLGKLKKAGLINAERRGLWMFYSISSDSSLWPQPFFASR